MIGELTYFLGLQIKQDDKGILICQEQYTRNLLKKYEISDSSSVKTPMVPLSNLGPNFAGKLNETSYRRMIGSLIYLTATRLDIQFSIVLCARYLSSLKESHLTAVKRILGTPTLFLYYPKCSGFDLKGYSDLDYAGLVMSLTEVEYVAAAAGCCASILWMKSQLDDYDIHYKMVPIFCENTSAIAISNNPVLHSRTKHIDISSGITSLKETLNYTSSPLISLIKDVQYGVYSFLPEPISLKPKMNPVTLRDVLNETNNVVCNFNYPPNVPAYKPIMKFLRNGPLYQAFTNCPSVVYQNFLREFWSTAVSFDHFSSTDEPEKRPFKEFLIKFSVSNGQRPLALDFKTFGSSNGLDYNNGKYVDHLTPEVLGGNYSSTEQDPSKVTEIELTAHMIVVNNQRDSVSPPHLVSKPKKGKVTWGQRLRGNKPPTDMEPQNPTDVDLSDTGAKYQEDQTQSSRLRYQSLTKNESEPSYEGELDAQPMILTYADVRALLLFDDELDKESDDEEVLATGDDMDEDTQADEKEHQEEATVLYANLKASIEQYYDENIAHRDQTDKLVEASMNSLNKSSTTITGLYKGLEISSQTAEILSLVKDFDFSMLQSTVKNLQDHAFKQEEASDAWMKSSTNISWNLGSRITKVELSQTALKRKISSLRRDTLEIKSMMTEMYAAFKGQSSSAPSGSVNPTLALTGIQANVEGENKNTTTTEEPPSHTEGKTEEPKLVILILSIASTEVPQTQAQPITSLIIHPESSQATLRIDKGKEIATESDENLSNKLMLASNIIRLDPDEPVRVELMINGKIVYLTEQEIQEYWDKEEKMKKVLLGAKLIPMCWDLIIS
ncbi:hypothetical protein Tco_0139340 [Tanacetum coccineum]